MTFGQGRNALFRRRAALALLAALVSRAPVAETGRLSLFTNEAVAPEPVAGETAASINAKRAPGQVSPDTVVGEAAGHPPARITRIDFGGLAGIRDGVLSGRSAGLRLNLLHGVEFEATVERSAPTSSGYSLSGPLRGVPTGFVALVVNGDRAMGRVYAPGGCTRSARPAACRAWSAWSRRRCAARRWRPRPARPGGTMLTGCRSWIRANRRSAGWRPSDPG